MAARKKTAKKAAKKSAKKSVARDRKLIAGKQDHEVGYEARRSSVSKKAVKKARAAAGPSRKNVRKKLAKRSG
jgi:hypothetical protein